MRKKNVSPAIKIDVSAPKHQIFFSQFYPFIILFILWLIYFHRIIFQTGFLWEDVVSFEFPNRIFARDCFLSGIFPLWDQFTFGGMPFFASTHTGVLYPTNILLSLLNVPQPLFWYCIELSIIVHIFIAGCAMYLYTRFKNRSISASLLASICYMFSGFFILHLIHPMMLYILSWLPLVVLFLEKAVLRSRWDYFIIAGLVLGISNLAGHPQILVYEFLFLGAYSVVLFFQSSDRRLISFCGISLFFIIASGMILVLYLPGQELSQNSVRTSWNADVASEGSLHILQFFMFLIPKLFGGWAGHDSAQPQFWLQTPHSGYYTYWDTCFYTGVVIIFFAIIQLRNVKSNRSIQFFLLWLLFSSVLALGCYFPLYSVFFDYLPVINKFRIPSRILFTWPFILSILSAMTLDQLIEKNFFKKNIRFFYLVLGCFFLFGILVSSKVFFKLLTPTMADDTILSYSSSQGIIFVAVIVALMVTFWLYYIDTIPKNSFTLLVITILVVDLFVFGMNSHVVKSNTAISTYSQNLSIAQSLQLEQSQDNFRTNIRQFTLDDTSSIGTQSALRLFERNFGMISKIRTIEGYNPYSLFRRLPPAKGKEQFQRVLDLLAVKYFINPFITSKNDDLLLINSGRLPQAKMFYSYHLFPNDSCIKEYMLSTAFDYKNTLLLSKKPHTVLSHDTSIPVNNSVVCTKSSYLRKEYRVETEKNGLLWLSEIWYPGWQAFVDNKNVTRYCADYSFNAFEIPAGTHSIVFRYQPKSFIFGAFMSLLTLVLSVVFLAIFYFKKRVNTNVTV